MHVQQMTQGREDCLVVDGAWNFNLLDDAFFGRLWQRTVQGVFRWVLMSPPCCTWSAARSRPTKSPGSDSTGPRQLRGVSGPLVWGVPGLSAPERLRVAEGNDIAERCIAIYDAMARLGRPCIYEMPAPMVGNPTQMNFEPMMQMMFDHHCMTTTLDQCLADAVHRKPTLFVVNFTRALAPWPQGLKGSCNHRQQTWKYADGEVIDAPHPPMLRRQNAHKWRSGGCPGRQRLPVPISEWKPNMPDLSETWVTSASKTYPGALNRTLAALMVAEAVDNTWMGRDMMDGGLQ